MKKQENLGLKDRINNLFRKYRELIFYVIVGVATTAVSLGVYYGLVFTLLDPNVGWQLQVANVVSWIASVTFAYFTNRKYVFLSKNPNMIAEAASFYASRLGTLVLDMGIMFATVTALHWNDKIMKLVVQVIVLVANYVISKFLVFRKKSTDQQKSADR